MSAVELCLTREGILAMMSLRRTGFLVVNVGALTMVVLGQLRLILTEEVAVPSHIARGSSDEERELKLRNKKEERIKRKREIKFWCCMN